MNKTVWVVGRVIGKKGEVGIVWSLQGIFATKEQAIMACRDYTYFIGCVPFGITFPHKTEPLPCFEYPLEQKVK